MKKYDVAVIGGGFAGFAAAVSAARDGASVIIIEKGNALGGAAVNNLVTPFMPYFTTVDGKKFDLSRGLFTEIRKKLKAKRDDAVAVTSLGEISFLEEDLKYILNETALEAGVEILFHAYLTGVNKNGSKIESVKFATIGGEIAITADYFVDATGDAQLSFLAGCPTRLGREPDSLCQPMTLCFRVGNADTEKFFKSHKRLNEEYAKARETGEITNPRHNVLVFKTPIKNVLHFNTTRIVLKNPTDAFDVTAAEIEARRQVYEIYDFMKKHADGLEESFLMMTAPEIGVRESRMIVGEYVLTEKECKDCVKFEDGIAACNYDIDIHNPEGSGTSHYYFGPGEYYTIPYRALIPKGVDNMLVAGRCISSDHGAQASYRIMPTVITLGEAAGTALALAKKAGVMPREVDIAELQKTLREKGAFIGE
ncbi:MAG: FAD-dependent oxidoreductase [Ruminococcaceae bacterium]|nr:FAD-dependent oxidoreductase [Oscillospiraceae bacterium]